MTYIFLALLFTTPVDPAAQPRSPDIVDVKVCDLLTRPLEFANRHVRVRGTFPDGDYQLLQDRSCTPPAHTNETVSLRWPFLGVPQPDDDMVLFDRGWSAQRFIRALKTGQLDGNGPDVVWQTPAPLTALNQARWEHVKNALANDQGTVEVVVTGRFDFAGDGLLVKSKDGHYQFVGGYGHLGSWTRRIVVERIDLAQRSDVGQDVAPHN